MGFPIGKNTLKTDLAQQTAAMAGLPIMRGVNGQPTTMLGALFTGQDPIKSGYGFMDKTSTLYGTDTLTLPGMATYARAIDSSNDSTTGNYGMYSENVCTVLTPPPTSNPFKKSWNSFKEIGTAFVDGVKTRTSKALDSPYDFVNYMTVGASDALISGAKSRADKLADSPEDFVNYATMGISGMVKDAVMPEDPFSKEHWENSFGVATLVVGGVKGIGSKGSVESVWGKETGKIQESGKSSEGDVGKGMGNTSNSVSGIDGLSRIDYLYNKYGKLTSKQLNERINLRGETVNELQKLKASGISNNKIGPAFAGVYDKTTSKYYYSINDFDGILPNYHPTLQAKYDSMPKEVLDSYMFTKGAGSHAEVIALNKALKANPNASLNDLIVNVIRTGQSKTKSGGMMFPRCPHCAYLTDGFEFITEVQKK